MAVDNKQIFYKIDKPTINPLCPSFTLFLYLTQQNSMYPTTPDTVDQYTEVAEISRTDSVKILSIKMALQKVT